MITERRVLIFMITIVHAVRSSRQRVSMTRKSDRSTSRWPMRPKSSAEPDLSRLMLVALLQSVPIQCGRGRECGVGRGLGIARGVTSGVAVGVGVGIGEDVEVGVGVGVAVVVGEGVDVGVDEGVDVGVGEGPWALVIR